MAAKTRTAMLVCIVVLSVGGLALATPVITAFSSTVTSGTATNKANDQDLMYLMTQNGAVTFQVTATGAEAYEWQVNKAVQAGATGNSLAWTVPNEKGIWEIHLKVTGGGAEVHQEWAVSTMTEAEAPDFFDYFADGKYLGQAYSGVERAEKDPWDRTPQQWRPTHNDPQYSGIIEASRCFLRRTVDGINIPANVDMTIPYGTWKFRYRFPDGNNGAWGLGLNYNWTSSLARNCRYSKCSDGHHHCTIPIQRSSGMYNYSFEYDGCGWIEKGKWHQVTIIRTPDTWLYMYNDDIFEFYTQDKLDITPQKMFLTLERRLGKEVYFDNLEIYENKYLYPKTEVTYREYTWNYYASSYRYYPIKRNGIVVRGRNIKLADIATALNDPSKFSYNPETKTAICNADLVIYDASEFSMQGETLKFNCESDGQWHFVIRYGADVKIENSTITTTGDHYFVWNNACTTTHFGRPNHPDNWIHPIEFQTVGISYGVMVLGNAGAIQFTSKNSVINNTAHIFFDSPMKLDITDTKFTNLRELDIGNYTGLIDYGWGRERLFPKGDKSFWVYTDEVNTNKFNFRNVSFSGETGPINVTFLINALRDKVNVYDLDLENENIVIKKSLSQSGGQSHTWPPYRDGSYDGDGTGMDSKLGLVNCKFNNISVPTDKAWAIPKYYLDVKVIDQAGQPVSNATVQINNEVDNENYPAENMTETLQVFDPELPPDQYNKYYYLSYQIIHGFANSSTVTGTDGHTPLPSDADNTMILADFVQDNEGQTEFTYAITAEKDGESKTVTGINPGPTWYRPDAETPTHTVVIVLDGDVAVCNRRVFYNNSAFDGENAAANANDDGAIAPDKSALLPGGTATFANYTSYSRGINGIMVDVVGLPGTPTAADFTFKVGNDSTPASWANAPAPASITVRESAGLGGSDRITIVWADNAIQKQWLQVTVKATTATGLASDDVFYFGNAIGETGNSATDAMVKPTDEIGARNNPHSLGGPEGSAGIDDVYDFDRDKKVGPTDEIIARNNGTNSLTALKLITAP